MNDGYSAIPNVLLNGSFKMLSCSGRMFLILFTVNGWESNCLKSHVYTLKYFQKAFKMPSSEVKSAIRELTDLGYLEMTTLWGRVGRTSTSYQLSVKCKIELENASYNFITNNYRHYFKCYILNYTHTVKARNFNAESFMFLCALIFSYAGHSVLNKTYRESIELSKIIELSGLDFNEIMEQLKLLTKLRVIDGEYTEKYNSLDIRLNPNNRYLQSKYLPNIIRRQGIE